MAREEKKLALSIAAERFIENPRPLFKDNGSLYAAFWRPEPFVAILLGESFVRERLLPAVDSTDFQFSLLDPSGHILVGGSSAGREPLAAYNVQSAEMLLRLHVWPKDPAALYAGASRRQNLYLGMLAIVVALLIFGGYLTVSTVRSELANPGFWFATLKSGMSRPQHACYPVLEHNQEPPSVSKHLGSAASPDRPRYGITR